MRLPRVRISTWCCSSYSENGAMDSRSLHPDS